MGAELLRRVGRVGHILVRLEFEQPAENRLPYIADRFSHFAHRIQMSRRIGQHRETMCQQPLEKKHHATVCRKFTIGKTHRVRTEPGSVPGLRRRHAHGIGRDRKIGEERGLILRFAVKVGPIQQQAVTGVADAGIARPDIRIDAGGEEFALMTSGVEADRIARIVAKPEIVERCRPTINRQAQLSVFQNQIGQHGQSPPICADSSDHAAAGQARDGGRSCIADPGDVPSGHRRIRTSGP